MKKNKILLFIIFIIASLFILNTKTFATETMNLNITNIKPYTQKKYTVKTPNGNINTIFKIVKKEGANYVNEDALYCLRAGLGFGDTVNINTTLNADGRLENDVTYSEKLNLKTDATNVISYYRDTIGFYNISPEDYNSILWIIDNIYLPEHEDAQYMKEKLLEKAEIVNSELNDDDIEFIQQMALWYFSNADKRGDEDSLSLVKTYVLSNATKIDNNSLSEIKANQIDALYNYFINNALVHATEYGVGNVREATPVKPKFNVNSSTKQVTTIDDCALIGPFSITKTEGNVGYSNLTIQVKDKNGKIIPESKDETPIIFIVKNPGSMQKEINSLNEAVNQGEFYLKISNRLSTEYDLSDVNIAKPTCIYDKIYKTTATLWTSDEANQQPVIKIEREEFKEFDLALRKYIVEINGTELSNTKVPNIDKTVLETETTAEYKHRKEEVEVKTGDKVTYKISVYNEGNIDGIVTKIIDYLPEGLEFYAIDNPKFIEYKNQYSASEIEGKEYAYTYNSKTREINILPLNSEYLFQVDAYDGTVLNSASLKIVCRVTATKETEDKVLTNIATMQYKPAEEKYVELEDRDSHSEPAELNLPTNTSDWSEYKGNEENKNSLEDKEYFYKGQEDDDDFDKVVVKGDPFDLALRKFITKVNGKEVESRIPEIDTTNLNKKDKTTGNLITTATYTHSKESVTVKQGDIVTYKIRIYNEGELDGYANKVADYIPEGLGYLLDYKTNTDNLWHVVLDNSNNDMNLVGTDGLYKTESDVKNLKIEDFNGKTSLSQVKIITGNAKIYSEAIGEEIIKAYNPEITSQNILNTDKWQKSSNGTDGLYYRDIEVACIVLADKGFTGTLTNIAEIQSFTALDKEQKPVNVEDRDSNPNNVDINNYNPPTDNSTYQQDDDDYEPLELRYFDLALRKFITEVNDETVSTRIPSPKVNEEGNIEYIHDKTPVNVTNSDIVTYTIRVYNEGTVLGYAMEISDDIPDGLVFLPEHQTNKEYKWEMYDEKGEETEDPLKAVEIRTKYLENELLKTYNQTEGITDSNPYCADVKIAFQVIEENITQKDRIIINKAQITADKAVDEEGNKINISDEDSIPNEWNNGEDDQDIEKIYVQKFDLALLKWVTKTTVTVDGKTTITDTGFTPYDTPEPIAKVVIDKKKINKTSVKFTYNIIVTNQGEIEGYATEITDYIPEGLEFVQEDNPIWTLEKNNKITTRALEEKLLKPGESATIEVVLRWKNSPDNLNIKTNIAEISEDYNEKASKDIDSKPDNVITDNYDKQQEDDDDKAVVMLELKTGGKTPYIWLSLVVLIIISGGIILIKKYVI